MKNIEDIILLDTGFLDENLNSKIVRLFITEDPSKTVAKTHINKQGTNYPYQNMMIAAEDLDYIFPMEIDDMIFDYEPDTYDMEEYKLYCRNLYLWEEMDSTKITNLDLLDQ